MLPVFISEQVEIVLIIKIVLAKVVIGMAAGFVIDFIMRRFVKEENVTERIGHMCDHDHCHCEKSIFKSSLKHTLTIFGYIVLISFVLNTIIFFIGEDTLGSIILNRPVIGPMIATVVGLIPNCAASVVITQLYLNGVMSIGSMMAGLLAGAGVGILVLFKENRDKKENLKILGTMYCLGVGAGIIIDVVSVFL